MELVLELDLLDQNWSGFPETDLRTRPETGFWFYLCMELELELKVLKKETRTGG